MHISHYERSMILLKMHIRPRILIILYLFLKNILKFKLRLPLLLPTN